MMTIPKQTKTYGPKQFREDGVTYRITATVRHDDSCSNGHNSFAVTADIDRHTGRRWAEDSGARTVEGAVPECGHDCHEL